jgi:hypothetical protein
LIQLCPAPFLIPIAELATELVPEEIAGVAAVNDGYAAYIEGLLASGEAVASERTSPSMQTNSYRLYKATLRLDDTGEQAIINFPQ